MNSRLAIACAIVFASLLSLPAGALGMSAPVGDALQIPTADRRGEEQTYLTFPEWFLVFSPTEYAELLRTRPSSDFPWFGHIGQFWSAYGRVIHATRPYPFNGQYHTMINVIGVSTSLEYGLKGAYETLIGRLTALTAPVNATPEDRLATREAQDYVDFIRVRPWYEFDFVMPLKKLWVQTPIWGAHPLRKLERRYLLTTEWAIKAGYAWALQKATRSTFEIPKDETLVIARGVPPDADSQITGLRRVQRSPDGEELIALPRYQAFTDTSLALARRGARFVDIAGNRGPILVSMVTASANPLPQGTRIIIRQPILTRPGQERRVLELPVSQLSAVLLQYDRSQDRIEHVFDY